MGSPLTDTLFRPTTGSAAAASAPPVRERGTHTRAGNAMSRTRAALMSGAAAAVSTDGTRITMAQVATSAGVAKATLYNHLRTRDAVLGALVVHQVEQLVEAQRGKPLAEALADAALAVSTHPVRSGLARVEPAALAAIGRLDLGAPGWRLAAEAVAQVLAEAGRGGAPLVLRWLASFLLSPARAEEIAADVVLLIDALPVAEPPAGRDDAVTGTAVTGTGVTGTGVTGTGVTGTGVTGTGVTGTGVTGTGVTGQHGAA